MIPVNQFILGSSDPLLYPSEKMTNSIDEQIAFLQSQKQAINEAYRRNVIPNANNGTTQNHLTFNLTMLVIVVSVIKIFLMNFVNFLMHVEDEAVVVVEVA
jgi:hypothetical protein